MFEELNYAELEEWRDELLLEAAGKQDAETEVKWIESISQEMDRREACVAARIRLLVVAVNMIVLVFILSSCCTVKGVMNDSAWILRTTADNIQTE